MTKILPLLIVTTVLSACEQPTDTPTRQDAVVAGDVDIYAAAVANADRPEADRSRDAGRKPAEVLEFFGIYPGMRVLDVFSGGGYYTELVSYLVGAEGHIVAHSNNAYLRFVGDEFKARHADNRLPNADVLMAENNELELEADQFDAILIILGYHDMYWVAPDKDWLKIDIPRLHAELYKSLKPGGILGVVDHRADAGSPPETGGTLHRIDPAIVIAGLGKAGFVLDAESDLLHTVDDDYNKNVFDPAVRGKTDRFVLRFTKPH